MDKDRVLAVMDGVLEVAVDGAPVGAGTDELSEARTAVAEVYARADALEAENASLERSLVSAMDQIHESDKQLERAEADLAALRARVEVLEAVNAEYDDLIRHMDAGGDFYEFQAGRLLVESGDE